MHLQKGLVYMCKKSSLLKLFFFYALAWCALGVLTYLTFEQPPLLSIPCGVVVACINVLWFFTLVKISFSNPSTSSSSVAFVLSILKLPFLFSVAWLVTRWGTGFMYGFFIGYLFFIFPTLHWALIRSGEAGEKE